MDKDLALKQSNTLILATHKMDLLQMRLFFYACSQYKGDLDIEVSVDELNHVLAYQGGKQREDLKNAIPTLMRNALVHIDDEDGNRWSVAITDSFIKKDGKTVKFTFNKSVQKELEELRGYTWMYLSNLTGMSSTYAVRLYEFCAMRLGSQKQRETFDFDINNLRKYLNCTDKYERFETFERKILKVSEEQINAKTNIHISYKKIKKGRSITSIKFSFKWKKNDKEVIDQTEDDDFTKDVQEILDSLQIK